MFESKNEIRSHLDHVMPFNPTERTIQLVTDFMAGKCMSKFQAIDAIDYIMGCPEDNESTLAHTLVEICGIDTLDRAQLKWGRGIADIESAYNGNMPEWDDTYGTDDYNWYWDDKYDGC